MNYLPTFAFKKVVSAFLFPVPLSAALLLLGLFFLWFTRRARLGRALVTLGTLLVTFLSYGPISDYLLKGLEHKYQRAAEKGEGVKWVVVLGAGVSCDESLPIGDRLSASSLFRLVEGVRLYREEKERARSRGSGKEANEESGECRLLLSGGGMNPVKAAEVMAEVARALGAPANDLVLETESWDTEDEARLIKAIVSEDRFILVTSASHIPRAMALFEAQGMHPVPAPAECQVESRKCRKIAPELPSVEGLNKSTAAFHEYMGYWWLVLRGVI
jgi:uncharacterized SAM-binding protein YcdF (DUF218 family)